MNQEKGKAAVGGMVWPITLLLIKATIAPVTTTAVSAPAAVCGVTLFLPSATVAGSDVCSYDSGVFSAATTRRPPVSAEKAETTKTKKSIERHKNVGGVNIASLAT